VLQWPEVVAALGGSAPEFDLVPGDFGLGSCLDRGQTEAGMIADESFTLSKLRKGKPGRIDGRFLA
jgi:hypothetical protein